MKKILFVLLLGIAMVPDLQAQYNHAFGTEKNEVGQAIDVTTLEKGSIIAGYTGNEVFGREEAILLKIKPEGFVDWSYAYGYRDSDEFHSVREIAHVGTPNIREGYAALGSSRSFGLGGQDMFFVRTDLAGNPIYSSIYGGTGDDIGFCMQYVKTRGTGYGYVMVGQTSSYPFYRGTDVYVVKADEFGNLVLATVIGGTGDETGYWIEQTRDGGFVIAGTTTSSTCRSRLPNQDIFVIRLDENLNLIWNTIIGGGASSEYSDVAYGIVENTSDGTFTVTGITRSFGHNKNGDAFLLNLKPDGSFHWMRTYGLKGTEQGTTIRLTRNDLTGDLEYVVSGFSTSYNERSMKQPYIFKTDEEGNLLWTMLYDPGSTGEFHEFNLTDERGFVMTGELEGRWTLGTDVYAVKTDGNGKSGQCEEYVRQRVMKNDVCQTSSAQQVFVDDFKRIENINKEIRFTEMRCDESIMLNRDEDGLQIYRDESSALVISTDISKYRNAVVKVYSLEGNLIKEQAMSADVNRTIIQNIQPGLYIVHITREDGSVVRKKVSVD